MSEQHEFPAALVERVARAIREAPMRATIASKNVIDSDVPLSSGDMLRGLAALRALRDAGALVGPDQVAVPREDVADIAGNIRDIRRMLVVAPRAGGGSAYMGQIMAECGCPREAECQAAGRCIAGGGDE